MTTQSDMEGERSKMTSETYMAIWGVVSFIAAFVAACLCVVAAIWSAETVAKAFGTVVVVALFSLAAALIVQGMIDRQSVSTPTPNVDEGDGK